MNTKILLKSKSGGVGKSFVAASLASALFKENSKVVLVEVCCHSVLPVYFGASSPISNTPKWSFQKHQLHEDFLLLSVIIDHTKPLANLEVILGRALSSVNEFNYLTVLDLQTGFEDGFSPDYFDISIEVVACDPTSVFTSSETNTDHIVLNKKDLRTKLANDTVHTARDLFGERLLCEIHFDSNVSEAFAHKQLLSRYLPSSPVNMDIERLALKLSEKLAGKKEFPIKSN